MMLPTDQTLAIINHFKASAYIPVHIYHHEPKGIGANWNACLQKANGEYIKYLFQDDILEPTCIEEMVRVIASDPCIGLVACQRKIVTENNLLAERIQHWLHTYANLQQDLPMVPNEPLRLTVKDYQQKDFFSPPRNNKIGEPTAVLFRKSLIPTVGWFNETLKQALDYEYWYRIGLVSDLVVLPQTLITFRLHHAQATEVNSRNQLNERFRWEEILYRKFYAHLHPDLQRKLKYNYSAWSKLKRKVKRWFT
jgi:glycosyltransferase involved in cell wall biosynthesis